MCHITFWPLIKVSSADVTLKQSTILLLRDVKIYYLPQFISHQMNSNKKLCPMKCKNVKWICNESKYDKNIKIHQMVHEVFAKFQKITNLSYQYIWRWYSYWEKFDKIEEKTLWALLAITINICTKAST